MSYADMFAQEKTMYRIGHQFSNETTARYSTPADSKFYANTLKSAQQQYNIARNCRTGEAIWLEAYELKFNRATYEYEYVQGSVRTVKMPSL